MVALSPAASLPEVPYWKAQNCDHGHRGFVAKNRIIDLMHSPLQLTKTRTKRVSHYVTCTMARAQSLRLKKTLRSLREWRATHKFYLLYSRFPLWVHQKLVSISSCESGGDPTAIGGGGAYRGKYQFSYSTWGVVGGSGDPATASESEQDYRAAVLLTEHGAGHWPVCG